MCYNVPVFSLIKGGAYLLIIIKEFHRLAFLTAAKPSKLPIAQIFALQLDFRLMG